MEAIETAGAVAIALGLIEVIKLLVGKLGKNGSSPSTLSPEDRELLREMAKGIQALVAVHNKTDEDGTPLHYTPRSSIRIQQEIARTLQSVSGVQKGLVRIVQELATKISGCPYNVSGREVTSPGTPSPLTSASE